MYTILNKQTSFFVALSLILVLFSTCRKDEGSKYKSANAPKIQWQKTIGNNDTVVIDNVQQTIDGGYILTGYKKCSKPP
jgi:hypothetical protein